jgi:hypothetical protein
MELHYITYTNVTSTVQGLGTVSWIGLKSRKLRACGTQQWWNRGTILIKQFADTGLTFPCDIRTRSFQGKIKTKGTVCFSSQLAISLLLHAVKSRQPLWVRSPPYLSVVCVVYRTGLEMSCSVSAPTHLSFLFPAHAEVRSSISKNPISVFFCSNPN